MAGPQHNMTARPSPSMELPEDERPRTQVERIGAKFGSIPKLHKALRRVGEVGAKTAPGPIARAKYAKLAKINVSTLYKWNLASGRVPSHQIDAVNRAARMEGIVLTDEDWSVFRK